LAAPDPNEEQPAYVKPKPAPETEEEIMAAITLITIDTEFDTSEWGKLEPGEGSSMEWVGHFMQNGEQFDMVLPHMIFDTEGKIEGLGGDANGDFTIEGAMTAESTFSFNKVYGTGVTMVYVGSVEGVSMKGTWHQDGEEEAEGSDFEIKLKTTSWTGWYMQDGEKADMVVELAVSSCGGFFGFGGDDNGAFIMRGTWGAVADQEDDFNFVKQYIGKHSLKYFGKAVGEIGTLATRGKWMMVDDEGTGEWYLKQQAVEESEAQA
jgi:hypothetical protein